MKCARTWVWKKERKPFSHLYKLNDDHFVVHSTVFETLLTSLLLFVAGLVVVRLTYEDQSLNGDENLQQRRPRTPHLRSLNRIRHSKASKSRLSYEVFSPFLTTFREDWRKLCRLRRGSDWVGRCSKSGSAVWEGRKGRFVAGARRKRRARPRRESFWGHESSQWRDPTPERSNTF